MSIHDKEREARQIAKDQGLPAPIPYGYKAYSPPKVVLLGGPVPRPVALFVFREGDTTPYGVTAHEQSPGCHLNGRVWRGRKLAPQEQK